MQVEEVPFLEEAVGRVCQGVPNSRNRPERAGARAQVGHLPQLLVGDPLLLKGIGVGVGITEHGQLTGPELDLLPGARRLDEFPGDTDRAADVQPQYLALVVRESPVGDHLQTGQR